MREELRQQVVHLFKRKGPASLHEAFECLKSSLRNEDIGDNAAEIIQLWDQWTRHAQGEDQSPSMPPTPSATSATTSNHSIPGEGRRPLKVPPQCTDDGNANNSAFLNPVNSFYEPVRSKHQNGRGSYITSAFLRSAGVWFEEEGAITLWWRPPPQSMHSSRSQSGPCCPTLFNIVSTEEAAQIGMTGRTECDILYGDDFYHPVGQQYKALRELVEPVPPRVPTPPFRTDSPAPSTISVTRSNPPGVQPGVENISPPQYSLSFKGGSCEFSVTAPTANAQFFSFAQNVFQNGLSATAARVPTLDANDPSMLIAGAVDDRSPVHMADRGMDNPYPMPRTVSQTGHAEQGLEHRNKRKATEEVAPAGHRRQRKMEISSLLSP